MIQMDGRKKYNGFKSALLIFFFLIFQTASPIVYAEVSVTNQTGTITITTPDGQVITVEAGQPLPAIPGGSTIEVVTGNAEISATGSDVVNVLINNATAVVQDGAKVSVTVDLKTGDAALEVLEGSVQVEQVDGTVETLAAGETASVSAPEPLSADQVDVPGSDPAQSTGRQGDVAQGLAGGGYGQL